MQISIQMLIPNLVFAEISPVELASMLVSSEHLPQDRIDKELKPVIQKTFQYHDKAVLFATGVEKNGGFSETSLRNL